MRVMQECADCPEVGETCSFVRACEETFLRSSRTCECVCAMSYEFIELRRWNYGYTDKTMPTPVLIQLIY